MPPAEPFQKDGPAPGQGSPGPRDRLCPGQPGGPTWPKPPGPNRPDPEKLQNEISFESMPFPIKKATTTEMAKVSWEGKLRNWQKLAFARAGSQPQPTRRNLAGRGPGAGPPARTEARSEGAQMDHQAPRSAGSGVRFGGPGHTGISRVHFDFCQFTTHGPRIKRSLPYIYIYTYIILFPRG